MKENGFFSRVFKRKVKYPKKSIAKRAKLNECKERAQKLERGEYEEKSVIMRARIPKYPKT